MSHLLFEPHHDGSPTYVDDDAPALGSTVTLRCRTSTATPATAVWVRSTPDAEPHFDAAVVERETEHAVWWRVEMHIRNPVQRYRFLVVSGDSYVWLNGSGVFEHDVPDANDFVLSTYPPAPDWGRDGGVGRPGDPPGPQHPASVLRRRPRRDHRAPRPAVGW